MAQIWYCIVIFKDPQDENKIGIDGSITKGNTPEVTVNKNASNKEEICFPTLTLHYLYFTPFYKKYMKYNQQPVRTQDCRILFFKYG